MLNPLLSIDIRQFWDPEATVDVQYLQVINSGQSTVLASTQKLVCLSFGREGVMGTRQNYSRQNICLPGYGTQMM